MKIIIDGKRRQRKRRIDEIIDHIDGIESDIMKIADVNG